MVCVISGEVFVITPVNSLNRSGGIRDTYVMNISGNESAIQFGETNTGLTILQEVAARAMGAIISGSFANNTAVTPKEAAKLAFDFAEGFVAEINSREGSQII